MNVRRAAATLALAAATVAGGALLAGQGQVSTPGAQVPAAYPAGALPNASLTPGDVLPNVTAAQVCVRGYSAGTRNVPDSEKAAVYLEYGITSHRTGEWEIDHLISLELGGSNSIRNLWPESYRTQPWNARVKDALEDRLHTEVCAGRMTLADAQAQIRTDWIAAYRKLFHTDQPLPAHAASSAPEKP